MKKVTDNMPAASSEIRKAAWLRRYFYSRLARYLSLFIRPDDSVLEINPHSSQLCDAMAGLESSPRRGEWRVAEAAHPFESLPEAGPGAYPDYVLLNENVHYERDIQSLLVAIQKIVGPSTRIIVVHYSALWRPLARLATALGMRSKAPEENWIAQEDITNLLRLTGFAVVRRETKIMMPLYLPVISNLANRWLAPLPVFGWCNMLNIVVARPASEGDRSFAGNPARKDGGNPENPRPSVSVVVAARNEAGNIDDILTRCPMMGPEDELILVEGNSTDDTWARICEAAESYEGPHKLVTAQQEGKGKGDAVRKGFSLATKEILMILDADLTVPPEDLPKFYDAIVRDKGEFINGSRLVYPMEKEAMRFFNLLGNKFFAVAFSFVLGQRFKDTLCGTKVISRENYLKLAAHRSYFGDFDPFGDFDLIFGAARMGLEIVEIPIRYRERTYGDTNIQRWQHGLILLRMLFFAARKIKFI